MAKSIIDIEHQRERLTSMAIERKLHKGMAYYKAGQEELKQFEIALCSKRIGTIHYLANKYKGNIEALLGMSLNFSDCFGGRVGTTFDCDQPKFKHVKYEKEVYAV